MLPMDGILMVRRLRKRIGKLERKSARVARQHRKDIRDLTELIETQAKQHEKCLRYEYPSSELWKRTHICAASSASTESSSLISIPEPQSLSPFFRLPPEIRNVIYELVLKSSWVIYDPSHQMEEHRNDNTSRIGDINSSLLMTCRLVHAEAALTLWQKNTFCFRETYDILRFYVFNSQSTKVALTRYMARICLCIGDEEDISYLRKITQAEAVATCAKIWTDSFFCSPCLSHLFDPRPAHLFPNLRELFLDFRGWSLSANESFPPTLLKRIKESGWKLEKLKLGGLGNHPIIVEILEQALLKDPPSRRLTNSEDQPL